MTIFWISLLSVVVILILVLTLLIWRRTNSILYEVKENLKIIEQISVHKLPEVTKQAQYLSLLEHKLQLNMPLPPTRGFAASPDILHVIAGTVLGEKPKICVEFGSGVSTVVTARCLQLNGFGKLYSFDHDAEWIQKTRDMLHQYDLQAYVEIFHAPVEPILINGVNTQWYRTADIPEKGIDFFVIDGPPMRIAPQARLPALHVLAQRLSAQTIGYLDDSDRPDEQIALANWQQAFPDIKQTNCFYEKGATRLERQ